MIITIIPKIGRDAAVYFKAQIYKYSFPYLKNEHIISGFFDFGQMGIKVTHVADEPGLPTACLSHDDNRDTTPTHIPTVVTI